MKLHRCLFMLTVVPFCASAASLAPNSVWSYQSQLMAVGDMFSSTYTATANETVVLTARNAVSDQFGIYINGTLQLNSSVVLDWNTRGMSSATPIQTFNNFDEVLLSGLYSTARFGVTTGDIIGIQLIHLAPDDGVIYADEGSFGTLAIEGVPEPSTFALLGLALLGIGLAGRRRGANSRQEGPHMSRNCLRGVIAIATFLCLMQVGAFAQLPPPTVSASALAGTPVQNRDAIQTILNANVGNTIVLPSGTFLIAPVTDKSKFLTLPAGTILRGSATLKVADNSAPYTSVFYSADCSGCDIRDFTIDANVANNPGVSFQVLQNESPRHEFEIWAGTDVLFQGITVKNSTSIQAILISGALGGTVQNVTVKDNSFVAMGDDPDHIIHDTSTVFVWGNGVKISGNYFSAASIGAPAAYTAIETHGSNFTISNNVSFNYVNGFNICGQNSSSLMANGVTVIGNSVSGALYGVSLYTGGVTVTGNSLRLNQTSYVSAIWGDYRESYGVSIVDDIPYTVSDVVIAHNTITFDAEASDRDVNTSSKGIGWISSLTPTWGIVNVSVSGNIIDNAPLSAIRFSVASAMGLKIANNIIRNAGQSLHAVPQGYKTPIFLYSWSGPMVGDVTGNTIIDDQATSRMVNAFLLGSAVTGHDLQLRDNSVSLLGTNTSSFASYITFLDGNVVPSLRETWANFALTTTQPVARGSRVIDPLYDATYTYTSEGWTHTRSDALSWNALTKLNLWGKSEPLIGDVNKSTTLTQAGFTEAGLSNGFGFPAVAESDYAYANLALQPLTQYVLSSYIVMYDGGVPIASSNWDGVANVTFSIDNKNY